MEDGANGMGANGRGCEWNECSERKQKEFSFGSPGDSD